MRLTQTETGFMDVVAQFAQLHGWRVAHFRPGRTATGWRTACQYDAAGWPDLVMIRSGRLLVAELKSDDAPGPTAEQQLWLQAFAGCAAEVHVWRPRDWYLVVEALERK